MAGVLFACPVALLAQTASQITPPSFAPPAETRPRAPLSIPADAMRAAPPGSETAFVRPSGLELSAGSLSAATLATLRERLVGRRISVAELFAAAGEAEAAEVKRGRVLVRVVVPQQQLADGAVVRLAVVEGFIERIDVSRVPARVRGRVARLLAGLRGRHGVTLHEIERRLALAGDVPGVSLRSTLAAGAQPGGTVLRIDADWRPVSAFVSVDNTLPDALGREAYGLGVDLNAVLGLGELVYLRASGLPNTGHAGVLEPSPRDRSLAAGLVLPLGADGLALTVEGTDARTAARHAAELPGFGSVYRRLSSTLRYPVVRRRALTINLESRLDVEDERVRIVEPVVLPISLDRLRVARGAVDGSAFLPGGGAAALRVEASFGIDGLGARSAKDATPDLPLSRAGSDASFRKLLVTASVDQPLARHAELVVQGRAQLSFGDALGNAEQLGIATPDAISPLPNGTLQGDSGYVVRAEARAPFALARPALLASLTPYGFAAQGRVHDVAPTAFERRDTDAFAFGGGVRVAGQGTRGTPGLSASIEYGRVHLAGLRPDRVTFSVIARL